MLSSEVHYRESARYQASNKEVKYKRYKLEPSMSKTYCTECFEMNFVFMLSVILVKSRET